MTPEVSARDVSVVPGYRPPPVCVCSSRCLECPGSPDPGLEETVVAREESGCPLPSRLGPVAARSRRPGCRRPGDRKDRRGSRHRESSLRRWLEQDDLDTGRRDDGLTSGERKEPAELRRRNRTLELEVVILKRASAYFPRDNVLPK